MLKVIDLENEYGIKINKVSNKYVIDNRKFTNLKSVKEYLDYKIKNTEITENIKHKDYLRFKTILVNGKEININDCQFLEDIYSLINWQLIKNHHSVLSITVNEKILLLNPNLFDNREKTKMKQYQYITRYGDNGTTRQSITRKEVRILQLEDIISIYIYGISNGNKYDIQCNYKKDVEKKNTVLAPLQHQESISKLNNHIAFHSNKSNIFTDNGIDYQLSLKNNEVYIIINNELCSEAIGQYNFISIPSIEYHYKHNGGAINDKEKKLTLGKIKTYLNNKQYSLLYSYLSESKFINNYKKIMVNDEIVELKIVYFNNSIATFNLVKLDKTYLKITLYPNYLSIIKEFLNFYSVQIDNLKTNNEFKIFHYEDELNKLDIIKNQKIKAIHQKYINIRILLKQHFLEEYSLHKSSLNFLLSEYKKDKSMILYDEQEEIKTIYNKLSFKFDRFHNEIDRLNKIISKLETTLKNLELTDYKSVIKKLVDSAMNSDNNKRLNHLLGNNIPNTTKVYSINSKIEITNQDNKKSKISHKQLIKMTQKFIEKLENNCLLIEDKKFGFNYFIERINRDDPNNPFKEKINIPKHKINKKILEHFDNFLLELCLGNINRLTSLPYIYPNQDIKAWLKFNNYYLSKFGIEIIEIKP